MVLARVRYLFYQPMDKEVKTWPLLFPTKKNRIWRRHCSIGQSCCSMKSKPSIGWFLESSPAWRFFIQDSLNQPNTTHVGICLMNQSNCAISVCLLFLFCLRIFISRSYKNRSKMNQWRLKLILTIWKNQNAPQGAKKDSFAACFWGKLKLACTIQKVSLTCTPPKKILTSRIDYTSIKLFEFPRKTSRASVELGMSNESRVLSHFHTVENYIV